MAVFVHCTPAANIAAIKRNGITHLSSPCEERPGGVFAMPVISDFASSHQWVRELRRWKKEPIMAVYFHVTDDEPVWVGHYNGTHTQVTAREAVKPFMSGHDLVGWVAVIPCKITAKEIRRIAFVPQLVGWRYFPEKPCENTPCPIERHLPPLLFVRKSHTIGLDRVSISLRDQRRNLMLTRTRSISTRLLRLKETHRVANASIALAAITMQDDYGSVSGMKNDDQTEPTSDRAGRHENRHPC